MAWNDTINGETDWSALAFLNQYVEAINERLSIFGVSPLTLLVEGDDGQSYAIWANLQGSIENPLYRGQWTRTTIPGASSYTLIMDWTWAKANLLGGHDWTRKYPRELATITSLTYTDGASFANGHYARNVADGKVYLRTSGAWGVAQEGAFPDTVTAFGQAQGGDYIGPWLFTEMRTLLNALDQSTGTRLPSGINPTSFGGRRTESSGTDTTWADAQAGVTAFDISPFSGLQAWTTGFWSSAFNHYLARAERGTSSISLGPITTTATVTYEVFVKGMKPPTIDTGVSQANTTFDNNGEGAGNGVYGLIHSGSQANPVAFTYTATLGSLTPFPPNWCGDPAGGDTCTGYYPDEFLGTYKFSFAYHP